jgi:hypothetical protein
MRHFTRFATHSLATLLTACRPDADGFSATTEQMPESSDTTSDTDLPNTDRPAADLPDTDPPAADLPAPAELALRFSQIKQFDFSWSPAARAEYYQLLERRESDMDSTVLRDELVGTTISLTMPLHLRWGASYVVRACNSYGCTDSEPVEVVDSLVDAVGYFKASNTDPADNFGGYVALSADGLTLAVGAIFEASAAAGIDGDQTDDSLAGAGAVYVFVRTAGAWSQQAYIKASNPGEEDYFGHSVALSADGSVLAVGAPVEQSAATGIDNNQADDSASGAGAVYVFERSDGAWSQRAYIKASNTGNHDWFGQSVALSADGRTLAVGAASEDSSATGIDGDQSDDSFEGAGAVYVFVRSPEAWSQQAYIKASDTAPEDYFGESVALAADGNTLAVSAPMTNYFGSGAVYLFVRVNGVWSQQDYFFSLDGGHDDRFARGVALSGDGNTLAIGASGTDRDGLDGEDTGAVYVFERAGDGWSQQAVVESSWSQPNDWFGESVALSADGRILAVGAVHEGSIAVGINGDAANDAFFSSFMGAVYVFERVDDVWSQRAYVKPSNTDPDDNKVGSEWWFGESLALSADGQTLAVGDSDEASSAVGIGGDQANRSLPGAGAVYLY